MKILVGYNGYEVSKAALSQAKSYSKTFDALVHAVTSLEGGSGEKIEEISAATENLKFAQEFLERDGIRCKTEQLVRGLTPGDASQGMATGRAGSYLRIALPVK